MSHGMSKKQVKKGDIKYEGQRRRHLDVLGLARDATPNQIIHRYRELAFANHPDRYPGDTNKASKFRDIAAAYSFLIRGASGDEREPAAVEVDDPYARWWWDSWGEMYPPREPQRDSAIRLGGGHSAPTAGRRAETRPSASTTPSPQARSSRSPRLTSFSHGAG